MLDAADSVRDAGLSIDEVTGNDPPVQELAEAGLVPESGQQGRPSGEVLGSILDELVKIREALQGGG